MIDIAEQYQISSPAHLKLFTKERRTAIENLRNNENSVILKPEKGSGVVIMNCQDISKMKTILDDIIGFEVDMSKEEAITALENKVNKHLKALLKEGLIDNSTYNNLKPRVSSSQE
ncbi:unnamed protein product [Trichobilharzia regenti]|nr:unnamed protein product [Trichobilharzia regenti]